MGVDRGPQQRLANPAATRRDQHAVGARPFGCGRFAADDEPGVMNRHAQGRPRVERVLQARKVRVGVHEHEVEPPVGRRRGALVVASLALAAGDEDVAQAAGDERPGAPRGARSLEQGQELGGELLAPKREQLDHHRPRPDLIEGGEDPPGSQLEGARDLGSPVVGDQRPVGPHAERRQRNNPNAGGQRRVGRHRAAAEQGDLEALRERRAQRERPGEMAEAERVLAIQEQRRYSAHAATSAAEASVASASASRSERRSMPRGRTLVIARRARSASRAAATCQRRSAGSSRPPAAA